MAGIIKKSQNEIFIVDFGMAPSIEENVEGKRSLLSPQAIEDINKYDQQDDIYAIGVNMYRILTGIYPFFNGDPKNTEDYRIMNQRKLTSKVKPPSQINPLIPKNLERVILKCLEKDKKERYKEVSELEKDLELVAFSINEP